MPDDRENIIYEERQVPSNDLGGIVYKETPSGIMVERRIPTCSSCGRSLANQFIRCATCGTTLCSSCAVQFKVNYYCRPCIFRWFNLPKPEFTVLFCIKYGVRDLIPIIQITGLPEPDIRWILMECISWECLSKEHLQLTEKGNNAVEIYSRIYGNDSEMIAFARRVRDWRTSQMAQEAD
jgi:hypothetical protein